MRLSGGGGGGGATLLVKTRFLMGVLSAAHARANLCQEGVDANNYSGNIIRTVVPPSGAMTKEECCLACRAQAGCTFWSWGINGDSCILRTEKGSPLMGGAFSSGGVNPNYVVPGAGSGDDILEEEGGWGMVFVICTLVCAGVYSVFGTLYVSRAHGTAITDSFPHAAFWGSVGSMVGDGVRFTRQKITGNGAYKAVGEQESQKTSDLEAGNSAFAEKSEEEVVSPRSSKSKSKKEKREKKDKSSKSDKSSSKSEKSSRKSKSKH